MQILLLNSNAKDKQGEFLNSFDKLNCIKRYTVQMNEEVCLEVWDIYYVSALSKFLINLYFLIYSKK